MSRMKTIRFRGRVVLVVLTAALCAIFVFRSATDVSDIESANGDPKEPDAQQRKVKATSVKDSKSRRGYHEWNEKVGGPDPAEAKNLQGPAAGVVARKRAIEFVPPVAIENQNVRKEPENLIKNPVAQGEYIRPAVVVERTQMPLGPAAAVDRQIPQGNMVVPAGAPGFAPVVNANGNGQQNPQTNGNSSSGGYPVLVNGKFIPPQRIVHFDLKGAPFQVGYFEKIFKMISGDLGATGILMEWEDMFPYTGKLAVVNNGYAYKPEEIKTILGYAKKFNLEVIPLIQTFGHLEWILKHPQFAHLREVDRYSQVVCLSKPEAVEMIKDLIDQVMVLHPEINYFHMGADEAFQIGMCDVCQKSIREKFQGSRERLMLQHISTIASYIKQKYNKRVLMWHDMLNNLDARTMNEYQLGSLVEPVVWAYAEDLNSYLLPDMWARFRSVFPYIWGASAFKGADGPTRWWSNVPHYLQNHISWVTQMSREYKAFKEFRGLIVTGWQRFDHFAVLCELFPVGIPSLAVNLLTIKTGQYDRSLLKRAATNLECSNVLEVESPGVAAYCNFPGFKIYQIVQQLKLSKQSLQNQLFDDYQLRGWLSNFNIRHNYSSSWYLDQVVDKVQMYKADLENLIRQLRTEMSQVFFADTVDEFLFTYIQEDYDKLLRLTEAARRISAIKTFPGRPFPILNDQPTTTIRPTRASNLAAEQQPNADSVRNQKLDA